MASRITMHLTVTLRAEDAADGTPVCVHNGAVKETVDFDNLKDGKATLVSLLCNTAEVIKKIGGDDI